MDKLLVTGASGRLAQFILPQLAERYDVVTFDKVPLESNAYPFIQGDITVLADMVEAVRGVDSIIHLAAIPMYNGDDAGIWSINTDGTFNVFEAAKVNKVKNVVFTSSVCAWGAIFKTGGVKPPYLPADENYHILPDDVYSLSKLIGEQLGSAYSSRYGINCISLRLATVHFPDNPLWQEARENISNPDYMFQGKPIGLRKFLWQYVDPRDLGPAFLLALEAMETGKIKCDVYNIGAPDVFSTVGTAELIRRYFPDVPVVDNGAGLLSNPLAPLHDITKARRELGYDPKYTWRDAETV
jgi:nucleoside-diphosphate-sugar epimerase